jgi:uncharacterized iron-regulated membrane protein
MKALIVVVLIAVLGTLASAGVFMLKRRPQDPAHPADPAARDRRMARALALRVGMSVALFLLILLAWSLGWIKPTGFVAGT